MQSSRSFSVITSRSCSCFPSSGVSTSARKRHHWGLYAHRLIGESVFNQHLVPIIPQCPSGACKNKRCQVLRDTVPILEPTLLNSALEIGEPFQPNTFLRQHHSTLAMEQQKICCLLLPVDHMSNSKISISNSSSKSQQIVTCEIIAL